LTLIDLSSLFVPTWKAMPADEPASAVHDSVVARVRRIADDCDRVAVCIDTPPYKRTELFPEYKAHRKASPEELSDRDAMRAQLANICETLRRDGYAVLGARGYEADDVIATLVEQATEHATEIVIVSGDKDLMQLVRAESDSAPSVVVQSTRLVAEDGEVPRQAPPATVATVRERFGVGPDRLGDWLALTGDTSDGVPGVPSIGPKRATQILTTYGSLELALASAEKGDPEMPEKMRVLLCEHAAQARLSRQLVELHRDVPVMVEAALVRREQAPLQGTEGPGEVWTEDEDENEEEHVTNHATAENTEQQTATQAPTAEPSEPKTAADPIERLMGFAPGTDAWASALEPSRPESAWQIANKIFNSRLFAFANVEQAFAAIMLGRSLGLGVMTICRSVHIVKGKMTMHVDLMIGLVRRSPLCIYWQVVETTAEACTIETHRRGAPKPTRHRVTIEDAFAAKLAPRNGGGSDSTWDKHRRQMLRHFCERELARMEYQDIVGGLYTPEELTEYSDVPNGRAA
jgi:5'-3' exonuclease